MKYKLTIFDHWDDGIFESFINFKQSLQEELPTFFPETLEDYKKLLHPHSPFSDDYQWKGVLVHEKTRLVAKGILAWKKGGTLGNLGFIDWLNDEEAAKTLVQKIEEIAKEQGLTEIKTPVDLNFFVKYRIKCKGGGAPYYGEPIYPDYYHDLFVNTGFDVVGTWDTYVIERFSSFYSYVKKRKALKERKHTHNDKVTVRLVRLHKWEEELKIVYKLFLKSFDQMAEFEPITYDQFKLIYDDFKYIINPLLSYIVELEGVPVGFSINYHDPLKILSEVKGKQLGLPQKALLLARLKLNRDVLLMPYMGKVPGPNGEEVKGVFIKVSKMLSLGVVAAKKSLVCYQSPDSPSKRPIDPELVKEYSKYVLYGKKL